MHAGLLLTRPSGAPGTTLQAVLHCCDTLESAQHSQAKQGRAEPLQRTLAFPSFFMTNPKALIPESSCQPSTNQHIPQKRAKPLCCWSVRQNQSLLPEGGSSGTEYPSKDFSRQLSTLSSSPSSICGLSITPVSSPLTHSWLPHITPPMLLDWFPYKLFFFSSYSVAWHCPIGIWPHSHGCILWNR